MSTQHTPGPWRVAEHSWCDTSILADGFDHGICLLDINHATEESQAADEALMAANARLIAAAPELLAALVALEDASSFAAIEYYTEREAVRNALSVARSAIAKATGSEA